MKNLTKKEQQKILDQYFLSTTEAMTLLHVTRSAVGNLGARKHLTQIPWGSGVLYFYEEVAKRAVSLGKMRHYNENIPSKDKQLQFLNRYFISKEKALTLLNVSDNHFYYLILRNKITRLRKGSAVFYFREEIYQLLKQ